MYHVRYRGLGIIHLSLICLSTAGCARHFAQVDFKYTSDVHLPPAARFRTVKESPSAVEQRVNEFIAKNGGAIETSDPKVVFQLEPDAGGEDAWKASRAVFEQEWAAFKSNDPAAYDAIARTNPLLHASQLRTQYKASPHGFSVRATMSPRMGQRRNSAAGVPFWISWTEREEIRTRLSVIWWPQTDGSTLVYGRAVPYLPKYAVEAAPGNWVAYGLWTATTGAADAQLVVSLFEYLSQDSPTANVRP